MTIVWNVMFCARTDCDAVYSCMQAFYGKYALCNQLLCLRFLYTCLPDNPVDLYQYLMACVNSDRVLDP